jgi:hypothetical protein
MCTPVELTRSASHTEKQFSPWIINAYFSGKMALMGLDSPVTEFIPRPAL